MLLRLLYIATPYSAYTPSLHSFIQPPYQRFLPYATSAVVFARKMQLQLEALKSGCKTQFDTQQVSAYAASSAIFWTANSSETKEKSRAHDVWVGSKLLLLLLLLLLIFEDFLNVEVFSFLRFAFVFVFTCII